MSAATADRLLASQRKQSQRGLSTTRAGTLLKQQIPIRTFQEWNETQPGFLEAERARPLWYRHRGRLLVYADAHRCSHWLDGVPSLAVPQPGNGAGCAPTARLLFPFPILGIDTDNGGEFINEDSDRLLRASTHHLHAGTTLSEKAISVLWRCAASAFVRLHRKDAGGREQYHRLGYPTDLAGKPKGASSMLRKRLVCNVTRRKSWTHGET